MSTIETQIQKLINAKVRAHRVDFFSFKEYVHMFIWHFRVVDTLLLWYIRFPPGWFGQKSMLLYPKGPLTSLNQFSIAENRRYNALFFYGPKMILDSPNHFG